MKQSDLKRFHRGAHHPALEPDLTQLPSFSTFAQEKVRCPRCPSLVFEWRTNGDGGLLQVCASCGMAWSVGRYYTDPALGPRSESIWSAGRSK